MNNQSVFPTTLMTSRLLGFKVLLWCMFVGAGAQLYAADNNYKSCPYSTNEKNLTVWNGESYSPIIIKGINLGVALPGKFPSELTPTYEEYYQWFGMIREAGFNTIRLYTLHYPRFYSALRAYNLANPQSPLLILHGVWLEEELEGYDADLYFLKTFFTQEIQDNINCIHGNNTIEHRYGKAYGTYVDDISPWVLGYIIGREVHPHEVLTTNAAHPADVAFTGNHLSIKDVNASEVFVTTMLDELLTYEHTTYQTLRPVSFSSWPTLDPLVHPGETTTEEDVAALNMAELDFSKTKAGVFISYHAYPYYPDFISKEATFTSYADYLGQNSYLGYLTHLKAAYPKMPLVIAEFGVPSSWGVAHYAQSGMNHGGFDEWQQGEVNMRMYGNVIQSGCGGGIMFSWIDEWFKRTWVTDQMDFLMERRIIWHNITAAEQNFGLLGFKKTESAYVDWNIDCADCMVSKVQADADFSFFKAKLSTKVSFGLNDTLWVAIDTYDSSLGESKLPNGKTVTNRAEFALMITAYKAELYTTQAYDLFGIWHNISGPEQLYRSIATDGAPWKIVRWKNNQTEQDVQYIGSMQVNRLNLPLSTLDAVRITKDAIEIRLPWTLLNFVDPSTYRVMNDDRATDGRELIASDGISLSMFYKQETTSTTTRYLWPEWNHAVNTEPYKKTAYEVVKYEMPSFKGALIASKDSFEMNVAQHLTIADANGLLINDKIYDGGQALVSVVNNPKHGLLFVNENGGFTYHPEDTFVGDDVFSYRLFSGVNVSDLVSVVIKVKDSPPSSINFISVYPNPSLGNFNFASSEIINRVEVYDVNGTVLIDKTMGAMENHIDLSSFPKGYYFAKLHTDSNYIVKRLVIEK